MSETPAPSKRPPAILPRDMKDAEYARRFMVVQPAVGTPATALMEPSYWAHVAASFHQGDRIEVLPKDGSYEADLRVIEIGPTWLRVRVMRVWPGNAGIAVSEESKAAEPAAHEVLIEWGGPGHKWRAVRLPDKAVLGHSYESKEAAEAAFKVKAKAAA